jgi:ubiquinone/menaquinone biosynthesis C-methylase UbiE
VKARSWDNHYTRSKSELLYPDENLVRLLNKSVRDHGAMTAVDLGCGSGRHLRLLSDMGISRIVGLDVSHGALAISRKTGQTLLVQGNTMQLPLKDGTADIIIAWGSLHYNVKSDLAPMLAEIIRTLKKDGHVFATLRSSRDTYLKRGKHLGNDTWITDLEDISGSTASFYSENEIKKELSVFTEYSYGLIERTLVGDISSLISHWIIHARK